MTGDRPRVTRDDLDECWCCGGLHDTLGSLCPNCDEAGCKHFGEECQSDHKPVMPDGGRPADKVTRVIIAQCTAEKKRGRHQARDLYMPSSLFKAQRRYAEAYADEWLILSAKYGLISPYKEIGWYDREISDGFARPELTQERIDKFFKDAQTGALRTFDFAGTRPPTVVLKEDEIHFEIICGEKYANRLEWYLDHYALSYSKPFEGLRYGPRVRAMKDAAREAENMQLEGFA